MTLREALAQSQVVHKRIGGEVPGTVTVSKANFAAGYFKDFLSDDPGRHTSVSTSSYWGYDYPGANPLVQLATHYGKDGWVLGRGW